MCCGGASKPFARNIRKPSMFLSTLIVKRRDNRRANKPNMLLDAILSNAISNIKKDKTISKLNKLSPHHGMKHRIKDSTTSTYSNYGPSTSKDVDHFDNEYSQLDNKEHRNHDIMIHDVSDTTKEKESLRCVAQENNLNDKDVTRYLSEVDDFFEKLNHVKLKNHNNDTTIPSTSSGSDVMFEARDKSLVDDYDEIVDNFIENGVIS
jgi:hypothetical protein